MIEFLTIIRTEALALIDTWRQMNCSERVEYGIMWIYQVLIIAMLMRIGLSHVRLDIGVAVLFAMVSYRQWQILTSSRLRGSRDTRPHR